MGRNRYRIFETQFPYFISGTVVNWIPLFANEHIASIIFDSLNYLQSKNRLCIYAYVLMENHYHFIVLSENLGKEIANFRSFTARKIIDFLGQIRALHLLKQLQFFKLKPKRDRKYQFWQEGSHPQLIDNDQMMFQKIEYIHNNPVKRGYIYEPVHWRYSSARNYAGLQSPVDVTLFKP
jgi:putative transposase